MPRNNVVQMKRPKPVSPEDALAVLVPHLIAAEMVTRTIRDQIAEHGRLLARKRGVAFIRGEQLLREFGEPTEEK